MARGAPKRARIVIDLTEEDALAPQRKQPRLNGTPPSSSTALPGSSSQASQPSSRTALSSSSQPAPSSQVFVIDDEEPDMYGLTQRDDDHVRELYGSLGTFPSR